jgi:hypothetical protein
MATSTATGEGVFVPGTCLHPERVKELARTIVQLTVSIRFRDEIRLALSVRFSRSLHQLAKHLIAPERP